MLEENKKQNIGAILIGTICTVIPIWTALSIGIIFSGKITITPVLLLWIVFLIVISIPALGFLIALCDVASGYL